MVESVKKTKKMAKKTNEPKEQIDSESDDGDEMMTKEV